MARSRLPTPLQPQVSIRLLPHPRGPQAVGLALQHDPQALPTLAYLVQLCPGYMLLMVAQNRVCSALKDSLCSPADTQRESQTWLWGTLQDTHGSLDPASLQGTPPPSLGPQLTCWQGVW